MIKKLILTVLLGASITLHNAQQKNDTVIVELAKTSKVIFTIKDRSDLEILKHYNFQELFQDILTKLEANDTTALPKQDSATAGDVVVAERRRMKTGAFTADDDDDDDDDDRR